MPVIQDTISDIAHAIPKEALPKVLQKDFYQRKTVLPGVGAGIGLVLQKQEL